MKDFDEAFRDRLQEGDETRRFPHGDRNWRQLSRRLDAFDAGLEGGHHGMRRLWIWKAAAAIALLIAGLAGWHNHALRNENSALRETTAQAVDSLKRAQQAPVATLPENTSSAPGANTMPGSGQPTKEGAFHKQQDIAEQPAYWKGADDQPLAPNDTYVQEKKKSRGAAETEAGKQWAEADRAAKIAAARKAYTRENPTEPLPTKTPEPLDQQIAQLRARLDSLQQLAGVSIKDSASLTTTPKEAVAALDLLPSTLHPIPADSSTALNHPPSVNTPLPTIHPLQKPVRFRVGAQAVAGLVSPEEPGVSPLIGQGITAEVRVFHRLWVSASVDWLRYDVNASTYPDRFNLPYVMPPHSGGPGPHDDYELIKVESNQRQQRYALGLRYALLSRGWVRPSVRVAHVWAQTAPAYVIYHFQEDQHWPGGNPHTEIKTEQSERQQFANIWRFGAGLEHETRRWSFGLWADYDKSFDGSKPLFDALTARASVAYQF